MASIKERNGKYCVIYKYKDSDGNDKQKWETYKTKEEAKTRKNEIEYKKQIGDLIVPECKTLEELLEEYVDLYGRDKWSLSTYQGNMGLINNYIIPMIGKTDISDINTRFIEKYYKTLLKTKAVDHKSFESTQKEFVSAATVQDIHKLLRSCFTQAVKWELMIRNPTVSATVPKYKAKERTIWDAETLMYALGVCGNENLKMALNLAFAGSLRIGELLALTWDCVDVSEPAIAQGRAFIYVNKELQRVSKKAYEELNGKDVLYTFQPESKMCKSVRIIKTPKTESSIRKVFLPTTVAQELVEWKRKQDEAREILGEEYHNYNLVMASAFGYPISGEHLRNSLKKLIKEHDLPQIVFHSLRHTSVTYKLKLNGGDIKAVQGDSGHSQINMVTDVYSHIIDEDRRKNAALIEDAFYKKNNLDPQLHPEESTIPMTVPEGVDTELLMKVLANPEMAALITSLAKTMNKE